MGEEDEEEDAEEEEEEEEDAAEDGEKQDIPVECLDCGETFQFTVGDQEFYETKGFEGQPKRCKDCRWAKKQAQEGGKGDKVRARAKAAVVFASNSRRASARM